MGEFTYKCKKCSKPILSSAFEGENVLLMYIENGEVMETMSGEYTAYGSTFMNPTDNPGPHREKQEWVHDWQTIVDMHFGPNPSNGIVAVHEDCYEKADGDPYEGEAPLYKTRSEDAGWIIDGEHFCLADFSYYAEYEPTHWVNPETRRRGFTMIAGGAA